MTDPYLPRICALSCFRVRLQCETNSEWLFVQQSRRHVHSLMHPDQASQAKLASLQPHLQRLSVLICSHLFWPKIPDANIQLELPGVWPTAPRQSCVAASYFCCFGVGCLF